LRPRKCKCPLGLQRRKSSKSHSTTNHQDNFQKEKEKVKEKEKERVKEKERERVKEKEREKVKVKVKERERERVKDFHPVLGKVRYHRHRIQKDKLNKVCQEHTAAPLPNFHLANNHRQSLQQPCNHIPPPLSLPKSLECNVHRLALHRNFRLRRSPHCTPSVRSTCPRSCPPKHWLHHLDLSQRYQDLRNTSFPQHNPSHHRQRIESFDQGCG
jgi:hypothetical protein